MTRARDSSSGEQANRSWADRRRDAASSTPSPRPCSRRSSSSRWRARTSRASSTCPAPAAGDHLPEPHLGARLVLRAARAAPADHLRRQGRVHGRLEDEVPLPGARHDPDRPHRRRRAASARSTPRPARPRAAASSSASTPRAPARATACCTRATPAPPAWRCAPARRSCRSASAAPARSSRRTPKCPSRSRPVRVRFGARSTSTRYADRADDRLVLRQITDEVMYEIRELSGPGLRRRVREQEEARPRRRSRRRAERRRPAGAGRCREPTANGDGHREQRHVRCASTPSSTTRRRRARRPTAPRSRPEPALSGPTGRSARPGRSVRSARMADITITLPDGSERSVPAGTTVGGSGRRHRPGLAKAAVIAEVNGVERDLVWPLADGDTVAIVTTDVRARALHDPPLDGPRPGPGRARPVPGGHVRHRPARSRTASTTTSSCRPARRRRHVQARRPRAHRRPDARDHRRGASRSSATRSPTTRPARSSPTTLQARDHRRRGRRPHVGHGVGQVRTYENPPASRRTTRRSTATPASSTSAAGPHVPDTGRSSGTSS